VSPPSWNNWSATTWTLRSSRRGAVCWAELHSSTVGACRHCATRDGPTSTRS
jgi:hypothetical protein